MQPLGESEVLQQIVLHARVTTDRFVRLSFEQQELAICEWPATIFTIRFVKRKNAQKHHRRNRLELPFEASSKGESSDRREQRRLAFRRDAEHASNERFSKSAVRIREEDPVSRRLLRAKTRREAFPRPIVWAVRVFNEPNTRVAFSRGDEQRAGVVVAPIEHIGRFEVDTDLRTKPSHALGDHPALIVRWNNDGHPSLCVRQSIGVLYTGNGRKRASDAYEEHQPVERSATGEGKDCPTKWGHHARAIEFSRIGSVPTHAAAWIVTLSTKPALVYAPLLANRYLTSRVIPFIAVGAVALCVALVIIVVSVMSGFLNMVRETGRSQIGDVVVTHDVVGLPFYDEFIAQLEALPEVHSASPVIETFGLLQMPYGVAGGRRLETVQVWGIDPVSFDETTGYQKTLYWKKPAEALLPALDEEDPRRDPRFDGLADAMAMQKRSTEEDGIVLGIEISPFNQRQRDGSYRTEDPLTGEQSRAYWMPATEGVTLTLVPVSERGSMQGERKSKFRVVNEFESGVYQIDAQRVLIGLKAAQRLLMLDAAPIVSRTEVDAAGNPVVLGMSSPRATTILIKAKDGTSPTALREIVESAYAKFVESVGPDRAIAQRLPAYVDIRTWEERLQDLIGPVEKERELMRTLFSIIYLVCAGLVLSIFWAIVAEKTRDIGILRAIGASRAGILWIFLRYGLFIGIVGSSVGIGIATLVVSRINDIHAALGVPAPMWLKLLTMLAALVSVLWCGKSAWRNRALATVLWGFGAAGLIAAAIVLWFHQGFQIWDPSVYYFTKIPSDLDLFTAVTTALGGIVFSVVGAAVPAAKAADTDPVRSLRYE